MSESETNETVQGKKSDNKDENRFSHLTADVCVYMRLRVCESTRAQRAKGCDTFKCCRKNKDNGEQKLTS